MNEFRLRLVRSPRSNEQAIDGAWRMQDCLTNCPWQSGLLDPIKRWARALSAMWWRVDCRPRSRTPLVRQELPPGLSAAYALSPIDLIPTSSRSWAIWMTADRALGIFLGRQTDPGAADGGFRLEAERRDWPVSRTGLIFMIPSG